MPPKDRAKPSQTQVRQARRARRATKQRFKQILSVVGLSVLGVVIIAGLALSGFQPSPRQGFDREQDGPGIVMENQGRDHLAVGTHVASDYYNSIPPTSGTHALAPGRCGAYDSPGDPEVQVHNLEHGFVVINYDLEDQATIDELVAVAEDLPGWPNYYVLAPYPGIEQPIALTAWDVIQRLDTVDADAIRAFAGAYRSFGPEPGAPSC